MPRPKKPLIEAPKRDAIAEAEAEMELLEPEAPESVLRLREDRFVVEYVRTLNASESARRVGYSGSSAGARGCQLLKKDHIKKAIAQRVKKIARINNIDDVWIMDNLRKLHDETEHDNIKLGALTQLSRVLGLARDEDSGKESDRGPQIMVFGDKQIIF